MRIYIDITSFRNDPVIFNATQSAMLSNGVLATTRVSLSILVLTFSFAMPTTPNFNQKCFAESIVGIGIISIYNFALNFATVNSSPNITLIVMGFGWTLRGTPALWT
ncbi:hypothetical protein [Candidatus Mycoplasma mahonii]|uniref:hypothetical protein n=1 Tax=Candidatus Mycoplasma mahonii TaxID=3004105 RepID=UPI0026ED4A41|nr:hypothetical protein [Candidatus Mycoplasma mahonii]WKX02661.1 hypothetical protein O3I44_01110 [Candidatus Mycoplasma mahonii]